jgi:hypothetical protein
MVVKEAQDLQEDAAVKSVLDDPRENIDNNWLV